MTFTPTESMGGVVSKATLADLTTKERLYQMNWVERLRTSVDFINPANSLVCIADAPFYDSVQNLYPLGMTQSFSWGENLNAGLAPEIGSRRRRAVIGSSTGGGIQISKMLCYGYSPAAVLTANNKPMGISNENVWVEAEWPALIGMNHDKFRTPIGIVVVEATSDGKSFSAYMFEQAITNGQSRGYQAGQALVVYNFNLIYEYVRPLFSITPEEARTHGSEI